MFPLNLSFTVNWTTPTNLILGAVIPAGMWVYVGPTTGAVNVAVAHASAGVTTAAFIFSDGTMTATVAGIIYPIAATATSTVAIGAQQQTRQWSTRSMPRGMPMRSLGAAATPQHMLDALDEDAGDWMVDQTVVGPGQSGTVFSDGWNVRVCGNGKAMLIKVA